MGQKVVITGGRTAGRIAAAAMIQAMEAKGFDVGVVDAMERPEGIDFPAVRDCHPHPSGKKLKPKRRRLKRKGGSKL